MGSVIRQVTGPIAFMASGDAVTEMKLLYWWLRYEFFPHQESGETLDVLFVDPIYERKPDTVRSIEAVLAGFPGKVRPHFLTPQQFAARSPPSVTYAINPCFYIKTLHALCCVINEELYQAIGEKRFRLSILEGLDDFKENESLENIHYKQRSSYWAQEVAKGLLRLPSSVPTFLDEQDRPATRSKYMTYTQNYRLNPALGDETFNPARLEFAVKSLRRVIKIFIRDFTTHKIMTLVVDSNRDTMRAIKAKLQERHGFPLAQQNLIFGPNLLADERTCSDYNIGEGSTVHLLIRHPAPVTAGARCSDDEKMSEK